jgi:hypothetical protein
MDVLLSVTGARGGKAADVLALELVARATFQGPGTLTELHRKIDAAPGASALASFKRAWNAARGVVPWCHPDARVKSLAQAASSRDVAELNRLLVGVEAGPVVVEAWSLPETLARRPERCSLLESRSGRVLLTRRGP